METSVATYYTHNTSPTIPTEEGNLIIGMIEASLDTYLDRREASESVRGEISDCIGNLYRCSIFQRENPEYQKEPVDRVTVTYNVPTMVDQATINQLKEIIRDFRP